MKAKILFLSLLLLTGTTAGFAQSGNCGADGKEDDSVTWTLIDGTLTISGTGEMIDYGGYGDVFWADFREAIRTVIIEDGVTNIGGQAFDGCVNLESVNIANSVKSINRYAFYNCISLTSIAIPASVENIEDSAFRDCTGLSSINLPENLISIEGDAFAGNKMTTVIIPKNVESIKDEAFYGCKSLQSVVFAGDKVTNIEGYAFGDCTELPSIDLPESLISIGQGAFIGCSGLVSIEIPEKVTSIGAYAFRECSNLTAINIPENNAEYASENGILFNKEKTTLICYPAGKPETNYVIPDGVINIEESAFFLCSNLKSVTIGNSVTTIGSAAFYGSSNLESVTIGSRVESIGEYAFESCTGLTSVINRNSTPQVLAQEREGGPKSPRLRALGGSFNLQVFYEVDLKNITLYVPDGAKDAYEAAPVWQDFKSINEQQCGDNLWWDLSESGVLTIIGTGDMWDFEAFENPLSDYSDLITSIDLAPEMTGIGNYAFFGCNSIESVSISRNVTSIGEQAFSLCDNLTAIEVSEENTVYASENGVLFNKDKTTLVQYPNGKTETDYTIPNSVTNIGDHAFYTNRLLVSVMIPNSVINIGKRAFSNTFLKSVTIGNSVVNIGVMAFAFGKSLLSITNFSTTPQILPPGGVNYDAFYRVERPYITLYVPAGSVSAYKAAEIWKEFNIVELSETETPPATPLTLHKDLEDAIICAGESHTFAIEAEGDNLSYEWYYGNERIKGANGNTYTITNAELRDYERYYVIVRSQLGSYRSSVYSKNVRLWVADQLPESLQFVDFPSTVFTGNTYRIKLAGYSDITQYIWNYDRDGVTFSPVTGGIGKNETQATFGILSAGQGLLTVTLEHPCGTRQATQPILVQWPTGVEQVAETAIRIFPNPTSGIIHISGTKSNQFIRVVDTTGSRKGTYPTQEGETTIDLSGFTRGTYLIQYNDKTVKVMKQ